MDTNEIKAKVIKCLELLEKNEKEIIQNDINERTIVHKLAEYLQKEFSELNVDVEYNRDREEGKKKPKYATLIKSSFKKAYEISITKKIKIDKFMDKVSTYPDIIVHKRMSNEENTLIIEVKKKNNRTDWEIDKYKLEALTRKRGDGGYGFLLGLHLIINCDQLHFDCEWYVNGNVEKNN